MMAHPVGARRDIQSVNSLLASAAITRFN